MTAETNRPSNTPEDIPDKWLEKWPVKQRANIRAVTPWGYIVNPDNRLEAIPDWNLVRILYKGCDYLEEGHSLREVCNWIESETGKTISHQGLSNIWKRLVKGEAKSERRKKLNSRKRQNAPKTKEEKVELTLKRRLAGSKRSLTVSKKRFEEFKQSVEPEEPPRVELPPVGISDGLDFDAVPTTPDVQVVFRPNPGPQTEFLAAPEQEVLYGGAAGGGKLVRRGGVVLTPFGFRKIEDLKVGDRINAIDGTTQMIIQLHPWVKLTGVRVHFHDGTSTDVAWDHLWLSWRSGRLKKRPNGEREFGRESAEVIETRTLAKWLDTALKQEADGIRPYWPLIPVCEPQVFNITRRYKIGLDPYQLGYWLGDGCGCVSGSSVSFTTADHEHFEKQFGLEDLAYTPKEGNAAGSYRFNGARRKEWIASLERAKLWGTKALTKFIPDEYKYGSIEARIAVLQGLMDTDGYVDARGQAYYTSISEQLANDVMFVVQSLGGTATITSKIPKLNGVEHNEAYTLYIKLPSSITPFRLQRKVERYSSGTTDLLYRRVVKIEEIEEIEGRCITVSHPSRCYMTNDFIVTHNSYALLADPMRYFANKNFNGLILRRTNDELRELIWKSQEIYPLAFPGAKWAEKKSQWVFPSGARLWLTYLEREEDVLRYQGQAFSYVGWDELSQHATPFAFNYMRSRLRTTDPTLPVFMRATTNPGGPGHAWVKKMFIDPSPPNTSFIATDIDTGRPLVYPEGHDKAGQPLFHRRFIPAKLKDNPYLYKEGTYEANLLSLPEMQRRQLLEGDWAIAEGAAFPEFKTNTHVIDPYQIPGDWRRFRSCDFGYSSYSAVHWIAIDPNYETLVVYRELYVSKHTAKELAREILKLERGENIQYGILDSSCWHTRGQTGPSIAEEMIAEGCRWRPSDRTAGARVAGRNRLHELLKVDEDTGKPGILFFNHCRQIIADLQVIPNDPKGSDDIDPRYASDHAYDSIRYAIMSRPRGRSPWDFGNAPVPTWTPADPVMGY